MGRILLLVLASLCLLLRGQECCRDALPAELGIDTRVESKQIVITDRMRAAHEIAWLVSRGPATGFPGCIQWHSLYPIGNQNLFTLENILVYQPPLFLQMCLDKYDREVHGYQCLFEKQERVRGKMHKLEKIKAVFREKPFSVYFDWQEGADLAAKAVYDEAVNKQQMFALPAILGRFAIPIAEDVHSQRAKDSGFYTIDQFGMRLGTERTLASMRRAENAGVLHVRYWGEYSVPELGGQICYKFVRSPFIPPEEDGLNELTIYIDKEHWLQVGSVLNDTHGQRIAQYFFRDVQLNPQYKKDQFTRKAL